MFHILIVASAEDDTQISLSVDKIRGGSRIIE
jgi:hypothetical protein